VIYLDTSVALAHLLAEDRRPPAALWRETLISSRLLEYELWTRIHARGLGATHEAAARELLGRVAFLDLIREVLARAREPFPTAVRTFDALHLASASFLAGQGQRVAVATYDPRMLAAARGLRLEIHALDD
jgi:predicted nucleic acid-binding protein